MSKVAIAGDPSGTGTFTIKSPNSNSDRTLTLPDSTGTMALTNAPVLGSLIRAPQVLTSGTSYTTPANCTQIYVECIGGGGGGGASNNVLAAQRIPMQLVRLVLATPLRAREVVEGLAEAQPLQSAVQRLPQPVASEASVELTAQRASPEAPEALALTGTLMPQVVAALLRRSTISVGRAGLAPLAAEAKEGITAPQGPQEALVVVAAAGAGQPPVMAAMAAQA
jgi:hypothetical protein